jgi:hypothetical protein
VRVTRHVDVARATVVRLAATGPNATRACGFIDILRAGGRRWGEEASAGGF